MGAVGSGGADVPTGTTTDGVPSAQGDYMPEGVLPQDLYHDRDGEFPSVFPAVISEKRILADRFALQPDLITVGKKTMSLTGKYNLDATNMKQCYKKNAEIREDPRQNSRCIE